MPKVKTLNAVEMLKEDHQKVKKLFGQFEKAKDNETKQPIIEEVDRELRIHSQLEEELFYPAMAAVPGLQEMLAEAKEEHHVVETLLNELQDLTPQDQAYDAKFMVMMENVQHHIEEEEKAVLPKASKADGLDTLAERMRQRKQELMGALVGVQDGGASNNASARRGGGKSHSRADAGTSRRA